MSSFSSNSVSAIDNAADVTSDRLAKQLGLDGKDGTNAWRVVLNSPVESTRSRELVRLLCSSPRNKLFAHSDRSILWFKPSHFSTTGDQQLPSSRNPLLTYSSLSSRRKPALLVELLILQFSRCLKLMAVFSLLRALHNSTVASITSHGVRPLSQSTAC